MALLVNCPSCWSLLRNFVCSVFYEGLCSLYQRFKVIVYKLRDAFCRVRVTGNNGASGVTLFVYFG